jgi:NADPH:quinone reductase-like Zn-dependent oxidoreductase
MAAVTLAAPSVYALGYAIVPHELIQRHEMTSPHANPILVTGAAGAVGSIAAQRGG